jgi:hypothetical protein
MDFAKASEHARAAGRPGKPSPARLAHKFTRANDFKDLSALLRNFFALLERLFSAALHFAMRNEAFRMRRLKSLK